jgi:hypothetical protein
MSNHAETLKSMLQDIINNRQDQAAVTMHDYFVAKSRDLTGLSQATQVEVDEVEVDEVEVDEE